jgi:uncharacterized membrane protein YfcA
MLFNVLLMIAAAVAGGIASISGFGIGSILTPLLSIEYDTRLAVAAVSVPHLAGTLVRFWRLRHRVDRGMIRSFGIASAAGGLTGALLQLYADSPILTYILAALLLFAGFGGLTGLTDGMRFKGWVAWFAGALSGILGGLVGNQGGIRSAAMLGFSLRKDAFVATATAIALAVDFARMPVYVVNQHQKLLSMSGTLFALSCSVVAGTLVGTRVLGRVPERVFRRIVAAIITALGLFMLVHAYRAAG